MYFSGDPTASRKRVDLGGRSSKEQERHAMLELARIERKRRQERRDQTSAAIKIQKCFRGRKVVEMARLKVRESFCHNFGDRCEKADWNCFGVDSDFLSQLLFFFNPKNNNDIAILLEACNLLLQYVRHSGDILNLFGGANYSSRQALVVQRVKNLAYSCVQSVYHNRNQWKSQLFMPSKYSSMPTVILLETVACLIDPKLPWVCNVVGYLQQNKIFCLFRGIILTGGQDVESSRSYNSMSSLEQVVILNASHVGQQGCQCSMVNPSWGFFSQLLSIPLLWHRLRNLKEVFFANGLSKHYFHQIASFLPSHAYILPSDTSSKYPGHACILGNLLQTAVSTLSEPNFGSETAADIVAVSTMLLDLLPTVALSKEAQTEDESSMDEDKKETLGDDLERQISEAIDSRFLQHLVNALFKGTLNRSYSGQDGPSDEEVGAVGSICAFLYVIFSTLPLERIMTGLAYRTEIVAALWNFIKRCNEKQRWPHSSQLVGYLPEDAPGWLLPLAVFCPIYKHMLRVLDNEEFYEQEKPLTHKDLRSLVVILKQALWHILWIFPSRTTPPTQKVLANSSGLKELSYEKIKSSARIEISELLTQLQDWNNRISFTSSSDFHAQEATSENFVSQAVLGNTRASEIINISPFLVPFTSRVRIFTSQLEASREAAEAHHALARHRFKIRRNRIVEDAFSQLSALSAEELRGPIRVSFVNEFGEEEAGVDGGGIFKDFMENITQAAFDVQYGLFKETVDHLLYPNPGSGLVHEQHLQYFHFLGSLLGKAMYEGILVDLPFAKFFLSKLKQKHNYLNDLPSLDPELYRHLLFLKRYGGNISELELYFVILNNEYGEQKEEELIPGGRDVRVTNENVITFIHLVANRRLNYQIRPQSQYFLQGFQQLIPTEWIDMFNEHELQLLISGSLEGMDTDDLRSNTNYAGGYHPDHEVIERFWVVLKSLPFEHQKKFLKFVTGCSRGPLLGFKYLEPKFSIQRAGFDSDPDRLPTSATCVNLLKLPPYSSVEQMRSKLLYAINAEAGFDLS